MGDEHLGELRLMTDDSNDRGLFQPHGDGVGHRRGGRHAPGLAGQAAFAEEIPGIKNGDHGLLALLGDDGELHLALANVEHGIREIALGEDGLVLRKLQDTAALSLTDAGEKLLGIE